MADCLSILHLNKSCTKLAYFLFKFSKQIYFYILSENIISNTLSNLFSKYTFKKFDLVNKNIFLSF